MDVLERLRIGGYYKIALVALEGVPDDSVQTSPASVQAVMNGSMGNDTAQMSDHGMPRHSNRTVWILAAFGAVAIHAGCVALALGCHATRYGR